MHWQDLVARHEQEAQCIDGDTNVIPFFRTVRLTHEWVEIDQSQVGYFRPLPVQVRGSDLLEIVINVRKKMILGLRERKERDLPDLEGRAETHVR